MRYPLARGPGQAAGDNPGRREASTADQGVDLLAKLRDVRGRVHGRIRMRQAAIGVAYGGDTLDVAILELVDVLEHILAKQGQP